MKKVAIVLFMSASTLALLFFAAMNPPEVAAVPSYARQTGLACSGCHYAPPELNPAGRRFKLLGYVDKADETKVIKTDGGKKRAALDLLASLPLSVMLETSFTTPSLRYRRPRMAILSFRKTFRYSFLGHGPATSAAFCR